MYKLKFVLNKKPPSAVFFVFLCFYFEGLN